MLSAHIATLRKHIVSNDSQITLSRNKNNDTFAFDVAITAVSEAIKSGQISSEELMLQLNMDK